MKVEGKVIIFTGAGSGLGLECVHRKYYSLLVLTGFHIVGLAGAGAHVIAVDRNIGNLKRTPKLHPYELDVTDWKGLKRLYQDVSSKYGRIDVVCNNAGLSERMFLRSDQLLKIIARGGHFWVDEDAENYPTIDSNLTALMKSTRIAISTFLKQPKPKDGGPIGVIVNTTGVTGVMPCFPAPVHTASKWGIYMLYSVNDRCYGIH